jgi:dihydroorotate dehydrogenase
MLKLSFSFLKYLPPELAHLITLKLLKIKPSFLNYSSENDLKLHQHLWGLDFKNPIGLAAGFDKNAEVVSQMLDLGFGFVETGTITPKPQFGNEKPRVFRLPKDQAIINHLGFNNEGVEIVKRRLEKFNINIFSKGIVGTNISNNRDTNNIIEDYCLGLEKLGPLVHYVVINISSPNTPGLRDLQNRGRFDSLIKSLQKVKNHNENLVSKPILVKIAPDINDEQARDIALSSLALGIDGIIISNSTIERPSTLKSSYQNELGGLSGKPLLVKSTLMLKKFYNLTNGQIPLIGVGGISNGIDCYEKIKAGASLVQLYTSLVYQGPTLISKIKKELLNCIITDGYKNIKDVVGVDV